MALLIKKLLTSFLKTENNWKIQLLKNWPAIIGPLSSKTQLEKIGETTLTLSVQDSCWLQELYLLSPILLKTINQKLDRPRIKRLRFKQAEKKKKRKKKTTNKKTRTARAYELTIREKSALKKIEDEQLHRALKLFLFRCHQEREKK